MTFDDLVFTYNRYTYNEQARMTFDNGYEVSVIRGPYSYGGPQGLYELAILHNDSIVYDTPVTDDVLGYLSQTEVTEAMKQVQALPRRAA